MNKKKILKKVGRHPVQLRTTIDSERTKERF